jgi:hypothetical protein
MIGYTSKQIETEFNDPQLNPVVRMIVLATAAYVFQKYGEVVFLTSIYRPESSNPTDTKSTHNFWRAVDADNDAGLSAEEKRGVADWINKMFCYDLTRPDKMVCLLHSVAGRGGDHFHIQVHPNTTIRREA